MTEKVVERLADKPDFRKVENMNLKPAPVPVGEGVVSAEDQPSEDDEDVMDYFRKLADS